MKSYSVLVEFNNGTEYIVVPSEKYAEACQDASGFIKYDDVEAATVQIRYTKATELQPDGES